MLLNKINHIEICENIQINFDSRIKYITNCISKEYNLPNLFFLKDGSYDDFILNINNYYYINGLFISNGNFFPSAFHAF